MVAPQWKSNISGDVTKVWWGAMRSNRKSHDRKWHQSRDRKRPCPEVTLTGSMLCAACATGSSAISTLVGPFDRKWQSHVTGRGSVRKCPWPEVCSAHARLFPAFIFLSSNMVTGCDGRSLDPFGVPLDVHMRNRKLRNTRSDRRSRDPFGSVLGVFSKIIGNPASYI
jgi:hypothetical protein